MQRFITGYRLRSDSRVLSPKQSDSASLLEFGFCHRDKTPLAEATSEEKGLFD